MLDFGHPMASQSRTVDRWTRKCLAIVALVSFFLVEVLLWLMAALVQWWWGAQKQKFSRQLRFGAGDPRGSLPLGRTRRVGHVFQNEKQCLAFRWHLPAARQVDQRPPPAEN